MFIPWYQYRPGPRVDRENKKEKLQNKMAYGIEDPVKEYRKKKKDDEKKPNPKDRFEELEKEISERESFLADMTRIGQGQLHGGWKYAEAVFKRYFNFKDEF